MAVLADLPVEILEIILEYVGGDVGFHDLRTPGSFIEHSRDTHHLTLMDFSSMSLVCKALREPSELLLYRSILWNGASRLSTARMCRLLDPTFDSRPYLARYVHHFQATQTHAQTSVHDPSLDSRPSVVASFKALAAGHATCLGSEGREVSSWSRKKIKAVGIVKLMMALCGSLHTLILVEQSAPNVSAMFEAEFARMTGPAYEPLILSRLRTVVIDCEKDFTRGWRKRPKLFIDFRVMEFLLRQAISIPKPRALGTSKL